MQVVFSCCLHGGGVNREISVSLSSFGEETEFAGCVPVVKRA